MSWLRRPREHRDAYAPNEAPPYISSELFTVKLHYGGVFKEEPKTYVGGDFEYFDFCDVDMMSLVELVHMLKECNVFGASVFYYRLPATDWVRGLFPLSNDEEVVLMCELVPPSRVVYVYADTLEPLVSIPHVEMESQEFNPSQDPNLEFVDNTNARGGERQQEDVASPEIDDDDDGNVDRWWTSSDSEDEDYIASSERESSFHSDSSNMDHSDEDVTSHKMQRATSKAEAEKGKTEVQGTSTGARKGSSVVGRKKHAAEKGKNVETADKGTTSAAAKNKGKGKIGDSEGHVEYSSDSTHYADSEEERMPANSSDEEDGGVTVFDENNEMENPKFKLGQLFASAKVFREAVRKQAIIERRPIWQCRNYGSRVKFKCEGPCEWTIYCSKVQNSDTYQVKSYIPKHTCTQTFDQKQINSRWIAQYYENEIRMNPTWPLSAFLKKVVNDWGCHVSIYAIARAKRMAMEKINGQHVDQYAKVWDYAS